MKTFVFGKSAGGIPITGYQWGGNGAHVLILGGVHGDEPEGVVACQGIFEAFTISFPYQLKISLIPALNMDGVLTKSRLNSNGVDLNRNLPTQDWTNQIQNPRYYPGPKANSEPENKALVKFIELNPPRIVISIHSYKPMLNVNGKCKKEAHVISALTGYQIVDNIGYPTPGCLGTYCGLERDMPTLTYEIEKGLPSKKILETHVPAILEALKVTEKLA